MSIHQSPSTAAHRRSMRCRNSGQFAAMTGGKAAEISQDEGGAVVCSAGIFAPAYRQARQADCPGMAVQAWPEASLVVRFELSPQGAGTRLVFDQAGTHRMHKTCSKAAGRKCAGTR